MALGGLPLLQMVNVPPARLLHHPCDAPQLLAFLTNADLAVALHRRPPGLCGDVGKPCRYSGKYGAGYVSRLSTCLGQERGGARLDGKLRTFEKPDVNNTTKGSPRLAEAHKPYTLLLRVFSSA